MRPEQPRMGAGRVTPLILLYRGAVTPVMVVRFCPPAAQRQPLLEWATRQGYAAPTSGTLSWRPPQEAVVARTVLARNGRLVITSDQEIIFDDVVNALAADASDQSWQQAAGRAQRVLLYLGIGALPITTKGQLRQAAATHCLVGGWSHIGLPDP